MALKLVSIVFAAVSVVAAGLFVRSHATTTDVATTATAQATSSLAPPTSAPLAVMDFDSAFKAAMDERVTHAAWLTQQYNLLGVRGKEARTAGFSLLRPGADITLRRPDIFSTVLTSPHFDFWEVSRKYPDVYTVVPWGTGTVERLPIEVSVTRLFDNSLVSTAVAVDQGGGLYRVDITFGAPSIARLGALLGISGSNNYIDWYGLSKNGGEAPTEMKAVLVSDNVAFLPISITDIVNQNLVNQPIVVARDLSSVEAAKIVQYLGF